MIPDALVLVTPIQLQGPKPECVHRGWRARVSDAPGIGSLTMFPAPNSSITIAERNGVEVRMLLSLLRDRRLMRTWVPLKSDLAGSFDPFSPGVGVRQSKKVLERLKGTSAIQHLG